MVSLQPQNPEFRNNPENIHPCMFYMHLLVLMKLFEHDAVRRSIQASTEEPNKCP